MSKNHTRLPGTHTFWQCDEIAVCGRCGAEFQKTSYAQRYCGCTPTKLVTTLEQSIVIARFRNICQKYGLHVYDTFKLATRTHGNNFYRLTNPKFQLGIGPQKRKLWIKLLERFNTQFEAGYFDIEPATGGPHPFERMTPKARLLKRDEPRKKECPMKLGHCPGANIPGNCPRNWKDCSFSQLYVQSIHAQRA